LRRPLKGPFQVFFREYLFYWFQDIRLALYSLTVIALNTADTDDTKMSLQLISKECNRTLNKEGLNSLRSFLNFDINKQVTYLIRSFLYHSVEFKGTFNFELFWSFVSWFLYETWIMKQICVSIQRYLEPPDPGDDPSLPWYVSIQRYIEPPGSGDDPFLPSSGSRQTALLQPNNLILKKDNSLFI